MPPPLQNHVIPIPFIYNIIYRGLESYNYIYIYIYIKLVHVIIIMYLDSLNHANAKCKCKKIHANSIEEPQKGLLKTCMYLLVWHQSMQGTGIPATQSPLQRLRSPAIIQLSLYTEGIKGVSCLCVPIHLLVDQSVSSIVCTQFCLYTSFSVVASALSFTLNDRDSSCKNAVI